MSSREIDARRGHCYLGERESDPPEQSPRIYSLVERRGKKRQLSHKLNERRPVQQAAARGKEIRSSLTERIWQIGPTEHEFKASELTRHRKSAPLFVSD